MALPKIIDFPLALPLTTILNGESFYCDFDLTSLFGIVVDTTTYTDVKIYLYHKQLLKSLGPLVIGLVEHDYWWNAAPGNITITGADNDQARIKIPEALTDELKTGTYMFMVSLEDTVTPAYEKQKGDAFIIDTAIDE